MRLFEIENVDPEVEAQQIAEVLIRDCAPYVNSIMALYPRQLYRGISMMASLPPFGKYPCPVNRKPVDTKLFAHNLIDDYFMRETGTRFRSNAIFASGRKSVAHEYGNVYVVYPVGQFQFCWSPRVDDMTYALVEPVLESMRYEDESLIETELIENVRGANYQTTDLGSAVASGNEVMIHCSEYYVVSSKMAYGGPLNIRVQEALRQLTKDW